MGERTDSGLDLSVALGGQVTGATGKKHRQAVSGAHSIAWANECSEGISLATATFFVYLPHPSYYILIPVSRKIVE